MSKEKSKKLTRYLLWVHRYTGFVLSLPFLFWFLSGFVMMYRDFPYLSRSEGLKRSEHIPLSRAGLVPKDLSIEKELSQQRWESIKVRVHQDRPVYRFQGGQGKFHGFFADTGEAVPSEGKKEAADIARRFMGDSTRIARLDIMESLDQWTPRTRSLPYLPAYKVFLVDDSGTVCYVSSVTGEVFQKLNRTDKVWAWLGAISHWIYFKDLRIHTQLWCDVVVFLSIIGSIMCLVGLYLGTVRVKWKNRQVWTFSPYKKVWFKWHHYTGFVFGLFTVTWVLGGLFSMNPWEWSLSNSLDEQALEIWRGGRLAPEQFVLAPADALAALSEGSQGEVSELELTHFAGSPYYPVWMADGTCRLFSGTQCSAVGPLGTTAYLQQVRAPHPEAKVRASVLTDYEAYYYDIHRTKPLPVLKVDLEDEVGTGYYVNPGTTAVLMKYGMSSRINRWVYHGLHSLDFPGLLFQRPLWGLVMILLLLGGASVSVTGLVLTWKVVRRKNIGKANPKKGASPKKGRKYTQSALLLFGAILYAFPLQAAQVTDSCTYAIHGRIMDVETQQPIPYATVMVQHTQHGVASNENGEFLLAKLCGTEHVLICSSIGYKPVVHHHDAYHETPLIYMAPEVSQLESIVVEDEATKDNMQSMAMETLDRTTLAGRTTSSLASAIADIQGVTFASTGTNVQLPVIHGLYGNRVLIVNNGVKHGFQNWGSDHAPEIDISNVDRVSVLKGASGVRYGPEALGGAVVVEGHPLNFSEKLYGRIGTGYHTNGKGYQTNVHLGKGHRKFSYHLGANFLRVGDRQSPGYKLTNTGMVEQSANTGFRYHLSHWDFKVYYTYVGQNLGLLRSSVAESGALFARSLSADRPLIINDFSYRIDEPRQNNTHHLWKSSIDRYSDLGKFSLLLSHQLNLRREFDVRRNADLPIIDLDLSTSDVQLEWQHPSVAGLEGTLGLQYFYQNNDNNPGTGTTPFVPNYNTRRVSVFFMESLKKGGNSYELGLRLDREYNSVRGRETNQTIFKNEYSFGNVTASLGMVREFSPHWQLRMNIGSAWRAPNMAELYSFGQHGFKTQFGLWRYYTDESGKLRTDRVLSQADEVAGPEKGYKWINELNYQKKGRTLTLTAYAHKIDNYIFERPVAVIGTIRGPMPVFIHARTDAFFTGMDLTVSEALTKKLKGTMGLSYLWSGNVSDMEPLIYQPPLNISADLFWQTPVFLGLDFSQLSLRTSYTFRQLRAPRTVTPEQLISGEVQISPDSEIFDFKNTPDGYFLGTVRWEWKIGKLGGQLEIENMFNIRYRNYLNQMRYFADEPGRNFLFTINYKF